MAASYEIDKKGQHAFVTFKASAPLVILISSGEINPESSSTMPAVGHSEVSVTINAQSIDTNHAERDKHLRSEEFFDVKSLQSLLPVPKHDGFR